MTPCPAILERTHYGRWPKPPMTPKERMRQVYNELGRHRLLTHVVEHGDQRLELGQLLLSVSEERWPKVREPQHEGVHDESNFSPECKLCQAQSAEADRQAANDA